jgi:hypothetical protein
MKLNYYFFYSVLISVHIEHMNRVLEKLNGAELVENFAEPEGSL